MNSQFAIMISLDAADTELVHWWNIFYRYTDLSYSGCPTVNPAYYMTVTNSSFMYEVNIAAYIVSNSWSGVGFNPAEILVITFWSLFMHGVNSSFNLCYCWVQEGNYEWGILVNNISWHIVCTSLNRSDAIWPFDLLLCFCIEWLQQ